MEDILLEFGGISYYIDFDGLSNILKNDPELEQKEAKETETKTTYIQGGVEKTEVIERTYYKGLEIDISRYETFRALFEILLTHNEESDTTLGAERALNDAPLSFKLAFNTLVKYGILKQL
jgi:hypothetical protein